MIAQKPTKPMLTRIEKMYDDIGLFRDTHQYRLNTADKKAIAEARAALKKLEKQLIARQNAPAKSTILISKEPAKTPIKPNPTKKFVTQTKTEKSDK